MLSAFRNTKQRNSDGVLGWRTEWSAELKKISMGHIRDESEKNKMIRVRNLSRLLVSGSYECEASI